MPGFLLTGLLPRPYNPADLALSLFPDPVEHAAAAMPATTKNRQPFRAPACQQTGLIALLPFGGSSGPAAPWWFGGSLTDLLSMFGLGVVGLLVLTLVVLNQRKKQIISTKSRALAETEARYRLLFEHSPIPLVEEDLSAVKVRLDALVAGGVADLMAHFRAYPDDLVRCAVEARIVDANPATLTVYGADEPGWLVRLAVTLPADPGEGYATELVSLYREGRAETRTENRTLAGAPLIVERRAVVAAGYEGDWAKVFVTIIDLTEQERLKRENKEFERQLQQIQKIEAIGSLAGGIAHDFNNLIAPILGRAELLLAEKGDDPSVSEHSRAIIDASRRARALTRQILTFSRQVDQEIRPVVLAGIVDEVLELLGPTLPANIDIDCQLPDHCPAVMADPTQLHQVIMNLAVNGCHAMEQAGGRLSVRLGAVDLGLNDLDDRLVPPGPYLRLVVADTGCGMGEATLARIFDPYFTTRPVGKGTGLGLPLVIGILRNCGGELRVTSEPGQGTVFSLYFPVVEIVAESPGPAIACEPMEHGSEQILLVDDEKSVADVTASMLARLGYQVTARTSSHDALEAFRSLADRIDLVITDLNMPQMTGLQLCRELRMIRQGVRVIVCTGFSEQFDAAKARTIGIQGFLNKPVVMAELARTVRTVLDA